MHPDPQIIAVSIAAVMVIGFMKGAFGGGFAIMVAHSGGPPLAMYLLPLGLSKEVYAGTTSMFFTIGNMVKAGPWLAVGDLSAGFWLLMAICMPASFLGVWIGWKLHRRLDQG